MLTRTGFLARSMRNTMIRYSHHTGGDPHRALPFDIKNKKKLTIIFTLFFGIGFGAPWLVVRHQMLKGA